MHAHVGCLDRVDWEQIQDVIVILLDGHCEAFLEHEVEPVRLLHELDTAIWSILLHPLDEHGRLFSLLFKLVFSLFTLYVHLELGLLACICLGLLSCLSGFDICGSDGLEDSDIKRCLALIIQHEKVMGQVSQLGFESEPVCFIAH